ncbi:helix-turn-helix domain-containing protein [Roseovarius sp. Pro17]|uniref:AlbA family DNA-binding domain-containing protein n=1 Tax=Roseovarius sp. Pro17 TaxID=3108175 RepID=UPI002D770663|nr:RNA-binding domain-containing protein [Roseovarius sp. Pro17]
MPDKTDARLLELVDEPREALDVEVKEWLDLSTKAHKASLAKEIIALANNGGGFVVVGFKELDSGTFTVDTDHPDDLALWSQDSVQGIVARYINPVFQCTVVHQMATVSGHAHPVIIVPGGHRVPVFAKKGSPEEGELIPRRVLIRRPGPNSEEPQSTDDWHQLFDRIVKNRQADLLDAFRTIMSGELPVKNETSEPTLQDELKAFAENAVTKWSSLVSELPSDADPKLPYGHCDLSFAIDGDFEQKSLKALQETISSSVRNHSGWPPFVTIMRHPISPKPVDGAIQSWFGIDDGDVRERPDHSDFWRVSPNGMMFLRRGYSEDSRQFDDMAPGTAFDITTPTWRLGEALLNASYIAQAVGGVGADLICHGQWTGLDGRKLVSRGNRRRRISDHYRCSQSAYNAEIRVAISSVSTSLPEIVRSMLDPLYELFDFFQPV